MGLLGSIRISASALNAQRLRMDVVANNVANMNSTRGPEGGPFRRQVVSFKAAPPSRAGSSFGEQFRAGTTQELSSAGVMVNRLERDTSGGRRVFEPDHPDADEEGFVELANVNLVVEMTDMIAATRVYEASVTVMNAAKSMAQTALQLGRG